MDELLATEPLTVPMMIVGGLFDQEDIYGGPALYKALAPKDPDGRFVHLVLGPWNHGQGRREGRGIGMVQFEGDTAGWFRRDGHAAVSRPLPEGRAEARHAARTRLRDGRQCLAPLRRLAAVLRRGLRDPEPRPLPEGRGQLDFERPGEEREAFDEYISDPAKPVPYRLRPTLSGSAPEITWGEWLMDDQRHAASRTDVLVYETEPLTAPLRVAGEPGRTCSLRPPAAMPTGSSS